jgi:hypothetical protein
MRFGAPLRGVAYALGLLCAPLAWAWGHQIVGAGLAVAAVIGMTIEVRDLRERRR